MNILSQEERNLSDEDVQAVELYQGAAAVLQKAVDAAEGGSGWASVLAPDNPTPEHARAMRYVIYFNQNFITIDTFRAITAGLKAEGLGWSLEQVGAVSGSPAYGKNPKRPPSMYRNKEDMRAENMRLLLTIKPLF